MNRFICQASLILGVFSVAEIIQPLSFRSAFTQLNLPQQELLIQLDHVPTQSSLNVKEAYAIPTSQSWTHCTYCGLRLDGDIAVFQANNALNKSYDKFSIAWSLWGEFFHEHRNDRYFGQNTDISNFAYKYYIDRPVFVLPMITLHLGHVLIDLLEQLYHTHMQLYGEIRRDCLIILDVAQAEERVVLSKKIHLMINADDGHAGMLLRQFTDLPVFGIELWNELRSIDGVIFRDLHIGSDISKTFFNVGQQSQPCIMSLIHGNAQSMKQSQRYREFAQFIRNTDRLFPKSSEGTEHNIEYPNVFIEQRTNNRMILNIRDLQRTAESLQLSSEVLSLDDVLFQDQLKLFQNIDVLVAVAGTGLHNVLFMRPGSAVILFMQPQWCEWAWMYANQAVLLGVRPFVYCTPSKPLVAHGRKSSGDASESELSMNDPDVFSYFQWSRQFWKQGPRHHKSDNITVDPILFASLLKNASNHVRAHKDSADTVAEMILKERSLLPLMCPGFTPSSFKHAKITGISGTNKTSLKSKEESASRRTIEVYVSSIKVDDLGPGRGWKLALVGEIGAARGKIDEIMRSMPHLSFCMESSDMAPWCYPVSAFNYYTDLHLEMKEPMQSLHLWAQASSTGGKIRHSDAYLSIDCRLPQAGLKLHEQIVGKEVHFEVNILQTCTNITTGQITPQVLKYLTLKFGAPNVTCVSSFKATFQHKMISRLSLQRFSADFCAIHALSGVNCADFVDKLQQHLQRVLCASQLNLPPTQAMPTKSNPFFFMHIDKTAGTTLREFIHSSLREPNRTALIPCHTEHCAVIAVPKHLSPTDPPRREQSAYVSQLGETEAPDMRQAPDMRLVQPPARDNSNLTVIAGHFDFYSVYNSLPQCQAGAKGAPVEIPTSRWSMHVLSRIDPHNPIVQQTPTPTPHCRVSCFTMGRHPVDRAISYYYQRFYQSPDKSKIPRSNSAEAAPFNGRLLEQRMMNELTPEQLERIALSTREGMTSHFFPERQVFIDEGMSDSACSTVLGLKYTTGLPVGLMKVPPEIPPALYPLARHNLQQCVVGIQEHWNDSLRVLDHWFPWIDFSVDPTRRKMSIYTGIETSKTLRPELYQVLVALNPCDMMLYEEMLRLFRIQLGVLENAVEQ